jgi:hypothetical protein
MELANIDASLLFMLMSRRKKTRANFSLVVDQWMAKKARLANFLLRYSLVQLNAFVVFLPRVSTEAFARGKGELTTWSLRFLLTESLEYCAPGGAT